MFKSFTAAAIALTFAAGAVGAATFSGQTSGYFYFENGHSGTHISDSSQGQKTKLNWGYTPWYFDHDTTPDTSFLKIIHYAFDKELVHGHNEVRVGALKWYNASSTHVDPHFNAHALLRFDLNEPMDLNPAYDLVGFNISSTPNSGDPAADSVLGLSFDDYNLNLPLMIGDGVSLTGFGYKAIGGKLTGNEWTNKEDTYSRLDIYAHVDYDKVNVVPLPAAGWMLLAGVGGLVAMRRRKKAS